MQPRDVLVAVEAWTFIAGGEVGGGRSAKQQPRYRSRHPPLPKQHQGGTSRPMAIWRSTDRRLLRGLGDGGGPQGTRRAAVLVADVALGAPAPTHRDRALNHVAAAGRYWDEISWEERCPHV